MAVRTSAVFAVLAAANLINAAPLLAERTDKPCTSFNIPVSITAHQHTYDWVHVNNNIDAARYAVDLDTWDNPSWPERIIKNITISKTYDIYATLCVPANGSKKSFLQVASHGG